MRWFWAPPRAVYAAAASRETRGSERTRASERKPLHVAVRPSRRSPHRSHIGLPWREQLLPWLPIDRAQPSALQRLQHAQDLVYIAADVQVMDHLVLHHSFRGDEEESA